MNYRQVRAAERLSRLDNFVLLDNEGYKTAYSSYRSGFVSAENKVEGILPGQIFTAVITDEKALKLLDAKPKPKPEPKPAEVKSSSGPYKFKVYNPKSVNFGRIISEAGPEVNVIHVQGGTAEYRNLLLFRKSWLDRLNKVPGTAKLPLYIERDRRHSTADAVGFGGGQFGLYTCYFTALPTDWVASTLDPEQIPTLAANISTLKKALAKFEAEKNCLEITVTPLA